MRKSFYQAALLFLLFFLVAISASAQFTTPLRTVANATPPAGPTFNYVNGCVNNASALTTNCSLSVTAGNLLVVASKTQNSTGVATIAVTNSGTACTWLRLEQTTVIATGISFNSTAYGCIAPATATVTVTVTWSGATTGPFTDISVSQWSTSSTWNQSLLDRNAQSSNTTSTTSCPTGTTGTTQNPNDLLIAICQNFNSAETWGTLSGWTNRATASRNTLGIYSKSVSTTGTQSTTVPLSAADMSQGALIAIQGSNIVNCSGCTLVQATNSANQTVNYDHISLTGVAVGNTLVYMVYHNSWSGSGTTTMSDSEGNIWFPCNSGTGGAASVSMTDINFATTYGMSCFYSPNISFGGTVVGQPTATDCSVSCSYVGGVFAEYSGITAWDAWQSNVATSTSGSNNMNCGSATATQTNDMVICSIGVVAAGTISAGTSPITFALANTTNGAEEYAVWTSSGSITPTETNTNTAALYGGMAVLFK